MGNHRSSSCTLKNQVDKHCCTKCHNSTEGNDVASYQSHNSASPNLPRICQGMYKTCQNHKFLVKKRNVNKGANKLFLKLRCINARSICNKVSSVLELLSDNEIDVCFLTESWLKVSDKAKFAEIREHGYDILSAPRKGRGGGVAFLFNSNYVNLKRNNVNSFK